MNVLEGCAEYEKAARRSRENDYCIKLAPHRASTAIDHDGTLSMKIYKTIRLKRKFGGVDAASSADETARQKGSFGCMHFHGVAPRCVRDSHLLQHDTKYIDFTISQ